MGAEGPAAVQPGIVFEEFVFEEGPFQHCHASTIAEQEQGLVCAWFGGSHESHPDVAIWLSRREQGRWTAPVRVAEGGGHPCWNPVLYRPRIGPLLLFYKVGPDPVRWWGMLQTSPDGGHTWSSPRRLPDGFLGPIKNKPIERPSGELLCPSSTQQEGWRAHLERTSDLGGSWHAVGPINDGQGRPQPAAP